jgi:hypothetical protein
MSCPTNFNKEMNFQLMKLSKNFKKTLDAPTFSLPRHNSSTQLPAQLPDELLCAPFVWLHFSSIIPPVHRSYDGPYAVLWQGTPSFTIKAGSWDGIVSVSPLKACTEAEATPGSP